MAHSKTKKLAKGDKIKLKTTLKDGEVYGGITFVGYEFGRELTIQSVDYFDKTVTRQAMM